MYIGRERLRDNVSYNFKHKDSQNVGKKTPAKYTCVHSCDTGTAGCSTAQLISCHRRACIHTHCISR